ncbi:head-tail connector protein [Nitrosomonas communis]|uniref:Phage gp6-like head-tail connector protein n=1 Tax=Nitrosomonas communis TaxID=44574 RepID=A0A1I4UVA0_9PROT|nr:phage head-tail connector protein [Nitrosomonas communis]SFM92710.1 phage conserved hypothetical protein, phiE125 gp8 family [Nitrosomonas communis]
MLLKLIAAPASEPITLAEAKSNARVTSNTEDTDITSLITVARQECEVELGARVLISQSWQLTLDKFVDKIYIPKLPLISITSIKYDDVNGIEQTIPPSNYVLKNNSDNKFAKIVKTANYDWPIVYDSIENVRIVFVCGYGNAASVPEIIKHWMKLHVAHWINNKEAAIPGQMSRVEFSDGLLDTYRVLGI